MAAPFIVATVQPHPTVKAYVTAAKSACQIITVTRVGSLNLKQQQ